MLLKWIIWVFCLVCISNNGDIVLNFRKIFNPKIYHNQCYNRSILGKNYNWIHQMVSIKVMLRYNLYQLLPFKNCRHWADFIILEMLWWRFWKRQSGEFCIGCNWIPCFRIGYRNTAITEHGSLSRDAMFCSSHIVHPYRRNQPWFQVYTSVFPRGARREKVVVKSLVNTVEFHSYLSCVKYFQGFYWIELIFGLMQLISFAKNRLALEKVFVPLKIFLFYIL